MKARTLQKKTKQDTQTPQDWEGRQHHRRRKDNAAALGWLLLLRGGAVVRSSLFK